MPRQHQEASIRAFAKIRTDAEGDADFSAQHMTLARTYLEIGMIDEAIAVAADGRAIAAPSLRSGLRSRPGLSAPRRAGHWPSNGSSAPQKKQRPASTIAAPCSTISASSSTTPARLHGRWRSSSNCRPKPATIVMRRHASIGWHASRPEADISFLTRILFAAYFLEAGLILVVAPWSSFWDRNLFFERFRPCSRCWAARSRVARCRASAPLPSLPALPSCRVS